MPAPLFRVCPLPVLLVFVVSVCAAPNEHTHALVPAAGGFSGGARRVDDSPACPPFYTGFNKPYVCVLGVVLVLADYPGGNHTLAEMLNASTPEVLAIASQTSGAEELRFPIPPDIERFTNVQAMYFEGALRDPLPPQLFRLSELKIFSALDYANPGPLSTEFGLLTALTALEMSYVQANFTTFPEQVWSLSNLQFLMIHVSNYSGSIPSAVGRMTGLIELKMHQNNFTGALPSQIGLLQSLSIASLHNNPFGGPLPSQIGGLVNLQFLDAHNTHLGGRIPSQLNLMTKLTRLELYINQLTGEIPRNLTGLSLLQRLDLRSNHLHGSLPNSIGAMTSLVYLDVSANDLSGSIPDALGQLQRLEALLLHNNHFAGELKHLVERMTGLGLVGIRDNCFSGTVPKGTVWTSNCLNSGLENRECRAPCSCNFQDGMLTLKKGDAHCRHLRCLSAVYLLAVSATTFVGVFVAILVVRNCSGCLGKCKTKCLDRCLAKCRRKKNDADSVMQEPDGAAQRPDDQGRKNRVSIKKAARFALFVAIDVLVFALNVVVMYDADPVLLGLWIGCVVSEIVIAGAVVYAFRRRMRGNDMGWLEAALTCLAPRAMIPAFKIATHNRDDDASSKELGRFMLWVTCFKFIFNVPGVVIQGVMLSQRDNAEEQAVLSLALTILILMVSLMMVGHFYTKLHANVTDEMRKSIVDAYPFPAVR